MRKGSHHTAESKVKNAIAHRGRTLEEGHRARISASLLGNQNTPRRAHVGYDSAHRRVREDRGSAASRRCMDCQQPAAHWSLRHDASAVSESGRTYSLNVYDYEPRCVPCHTAYDRRPNGALQMA